MKSFEEKIRDLENERKPHQERMVTVMELKETDSREFTESEGVQYDEDAKELKRINKDIERLQAHQEALTGARPVERSSGNGEPEHSPARYRSPVEVNKVPLEPGILMARVAITQMKSYMERVPAIELAKRYYRDTPEVAMYLRAVVDAADTTTSGWASQLVPAAGNPGGDFLEYLRPKTLIGKIPGLRNVPFNIAVPVQSGGGTYQWVGESRAKPVTSATFTSATIRWSKIAAIIVLSKELAKFSNPSAERVIRDEMVAGVAQYMDTQFTDPAVAAVANVSPASITNGITPKTPTGTTAGDLRYDIGRMVTDFTTAGSDLGSAVLLMNSTTAINASLMTNSLGQSEFPGLTKDGGTIAGIPVIVSNNVGTRIILVNANEILYADDGQTTIDVSEQASVEMNTVPLSGEESPITGAVLHSLWQWNEIGLRVERFVSWTRARSTSVAFIATPLYVPTHT